jgi:hypothetical protein
MFTVASVSLCLGYLMLVWLRTNAFVEYTTLLKMERFFHVAEYNELHKHGYGGNYVDFLVEYYNDNFFVRLSSCPVCLSFWLGAFSALALDSFSAIVGAPLILFFYLLFNKML